MSRFRRPPDDGTARDLSETRTKRAGAEAEVQRLRRALDALPVGVVLADDRGVLQVRNEAAGQYSGHAEVLVAAAIDRHLHLAALGRPGGQSVELFGPPRRVVVVTAIPLPDGGALATVEDISERARLDSVRTDFVANISHELKTPVGALAVLAEALADNDDPEVMKRLANRMVDEAHRASSTIDDLLELSRIELGGEAVREALDLCLVVAESVSRCRPAAERRNITIEVEELQPTTVLGDSRQLVSALTNLVDNAVKYSDDGTAVSICVRGEGAMIALSVADHGVGIPARDLDRVFERFYRVDRGRSRETGGTGLGLAIVRHVATNHGGDVQVQSREGEGSTFTLHIPANERL